MNHLKVCHSLDILQRGQRFMGIHFETWAHKSLYMANLHTKHAWTTRSLTWQGHTKLTRASFLLTLTQKLSLQRSQSWSLSSSWFCFLPGRPQSGRHFRHSSICFRLSSSATQEEELQSTCVCKVSFFCVIMGFKIDYLGSSEQFWSSYCLWIGSKICCQLCLIAC